MTMENTPTGIVLRWPANLRRGSCGEQHRPSGLAGSLTLPVTVTNGVSSTTDRRPATRQFYRLAVR